MGIAMLTLTDIVLFAWQLLPGTDSAEASGPGAGTKRRGAFKMHRTVFAGRIAATPRGATWMFRGHNRTRAKIDGRRRSSGRESSHSLRGADRGDAAGRDVDVPRGN